MRDAGLPELRHAGSNHLYFSAPGGHVLRLLDVAYEGPSTQVVGSLGVCGHRGAGPAGSEDLTNAPRPLPRRRADLRPPWRGQARLTSFWADLRSPRGASPRGGFRR